MVSHIKTLTKAASFIFAAVAMLLVSQPAHAVIEGSTREHMEYLDFGEGLIRDTLYARKGRATFSNEKKEYVRGVIRHNEPIIYEPDVYTWELAMKEHRKQMIELAPPEMPEMKAQREARQNKRGRRNRNNYSQPTMMEAPYMGYPSTLPDNPMPYFNGSQHCEQPKRKGSKRRKQQGFAVQPYPEQVVMPSGQTMMLQNTPALPGNAQETMNNLLYRARARGIYPSNQLQGMQIRERLGNGTKGYSYDSSYDSDF